ncbi:MAG: LytR family transcriptional regulator [Lachnospiraceae bacterium]|nr:LytR family transcriptional regulator [Lachnospiraceae bacterium]
MDKDNKNTSATKKSILSKVIIGLAGTIALAIIIFVCYVLHLLSLPRRDLDGNTVPSFDPVETTTEEEDTSGLEDLPVVTAPSTNPGETIEQTTVTHRDEKGVYNIILLGADKVSGYLTDSMIVVTINQNDNSIKMTSFMRDMWVSIPGKSPNRLNTVYQKGGRDLLFQVYREHFGIELHGYVLVDYSSLADVVDALGGVEIYVSKRIADFLNTSNYIPKEYCTLIPGATQTLNGAQVVGYCRQRQLGNGVEANDFARTQRQREVLNAIYEKFRNKSLVELLGVMEKVLPLVLTDMSSAEMIDIATKAITAGLGDIEQMRIPINGTYADYTYKENVDDIGKRVMKIDFEANAKALHDFLFGSDEVSEEPTAAGN